MIARLLFILAALLFVASVLGLGCLIAPLDAHADPTPTAEQLDMSQFGYLGLPRAKVSVPARIREMCWDGAWCEDEFTNVELWMMTIDWTHQETHWVYIADQGCYELVYSKSGGFGADGNPHPDRGAWWVECG